MADFRRSSFPFVRFFGAAAAGRLSRDLLLSAAAAVAVTSTGVMMNQQPRANPWRPASWAEWFWEPVQRNAFMQMPSIGADLQAVFALPNSDLVWGAGTGGLLLRSEDGGRTWERGTVTRAPAVHVDTAGAGGKVFLPGPALVPLDSLGLAALQNQRLNLLDRRSRAQSANDTALARMLQDSLDANSATSVLIVTDALDRASEGALRQVPLATDPAPGVGPSVGETVVPGETVGPGETLSAAAASGYADAIFSLSFVNDSIGFAASYGGEVLSTRDGGRTWAASPAVQHPILAIRFETPTTGWFETAGALFSTSDGGRRWAVAQLPAGRPSPAWLGAPITSHETPWIDLPTDTVTPDAMFLLDDSTAWAAFSDGGSGSVVRRITLGSSAGMTASGPVPEKPGPLPRLHALYFADASHGWAVTEDGRLFRTENGGRRWDESRLPGRYPLWNLRFTDPHHGWAVGANGTILATRDGGRRWRVVSGGGDQLQAASFWDARRGWAVGTGGTILRTTDGGRTWNPQQSGTFQALHAVKALGPRSAVAVGEGTTVLRTTNGRRWARVGPDSASFPDYAPALHVLSFPDPSTGYAFGERGTVLRTRDGGASWDTLPRIGRSHVVAAQMDAAGRGRFLGAEGRALRTRDGGRSWQFDSLAVVGAPVGGWTSIRPRAWRSGGWAVAPVSTYLHLDAHAQLYTSADSTWAAGPGGGIYVSGDSGRSWALADTARAPDLYGLARAPDGRIWAVGKGGAILSRDADGAWRSVGGPGPRRPAPWYYASWALVFGLLFLALRPRRPEAITDLVEGTLVSDRPLEHGEPDPLELGDLARAVSRFLRNDRTDPPLTIAVTGAWGSGKSSLMNLIRGDLRAWGFRPVWFNAWHHQTEEHLLAAFLENVRAQAIPPLLSLSGLRFRARLLLARRSGLLFFLLLALCFLGGSLWADPSRGERIWSGLVAVPGKDASWQDVVVKLFPDVAALTAVVGVLTVLARSMQAFGVNPAALMRSISGNANLRQLEEKTSFRHRFAKEFGEVTRALKPWDLVVFVDDLDRCRSRQVLDVLEGINFLCSSGSCVVIMGMDMDRVEQCVAAQLKDEAAIGLAEEASPARAPAQPPGPDPLRAFARSYLEKLVNIEVPVPRADARRAVGLMVRDRDGNGGAARPRRLAAGWRAAGSLAPAGLGVLVAGVALWSGFAAFQPSPGAVANSLAPAAAEQANPAAPAGDPAAGAPAPGVPDSLPGAADAGRSAGFNPAPRTDLSHWPAAVLAAAAVLLALGMLLARPDPSEHDSPRFETALRAWGPYVATHLGTPRAIKKYLNRVRFCAMRQRVPETTPSPAERVWRRLAGDGRRPEYVPDAVGDDVLVAIAALYECDPGALDRPETLTGFAAFVQRTLGDPAPGDEGDPRAHLRYDDSLDPGHLATYRRLAASVRLDPRHG